jgi:hypothetical protein
MSKAETLHQRKQTCIPDSVYAHPGKAVLVKRFLLSCVPDRLFDSFCYVRTALLEVCRIPQRIRTVREKTSRYPYNGCGPLFEVDSDGYLVYCKETLACSNCIAKIYAMFPWANEAEGLVALEAWKMAIAFAGGNLGSGNTDTQKQPSSTVSNS